MTGACRHWLPDSLLHACLVAMGQGGALHIASLAWPDGFAARQPSISPSGQACHRLVWFPLSCLLYPLLRPPSFPSASGIPPFFVAFVVTPLASNASEAISSFIFALKRRQRTISLTYSQVYGAISMNNTL